MFKFLNSLTYNGTCGTVLQLEDLGDCFLMRVVFIRPAQTHASGVTSASADATQQNVTACTGGSRAGTAVQLSP